MKALNESLKPAITDIEISWHVPEGYDVIQSPCKVPFVFDGDRLVLYGLLSRPPGEDKDSPRTPQRRRMDRTMRSFSNNSVKVFWFDDDMEYLPEEQLLLEIEEQERFVDEEGNENDYQMDEQFGSHNCIDPVGFGNQNPFTKTAARTPTPGTQESNDFLTMHGRSSSPSRDYARSTSPSRDHTRSTSPSRDRSFSNSSKFDENDVVHNIVFGNFFKDIDKSLESSQCEFNDFNHDSKDTLLNMAMAEKKDEVQHEQHSFESNESHSKNAQSKRQTFALEKEVNDKVGKEEMNLKQMNGKQDNRRSNKSQSRDQESKDESNHACDNKETANQQSSRYNERDSGVGLSMDDSDKPFEEGLISNDTNLGLDEETNEVRPPTEGNNPTHEELECLDSKYYTVIKNSDVLEKLGLPKNFGAVSIKGYVGNEEIEQVMLFYDIYTVTSNEFAEFAV
jgi:hypothetical protein